MIRAAREILKDLLILSDFRLWFPLDTLFADEALIGFTSWMFGFW